VVGVVRHEGSDRIGVGRNWRSFGRTGDECGWMVADSVGTDLVCDDSERTGADCVDTRGEILGKI
jgi:hypothetical protein